MFADDICVFCPNVPWLQKILYVFQAYAESRGIIFNCNKTVCMTFKAKSAKSTATPVLKLGGQYVKPEPIGPIASNRALRLRGPRATPTYLRKLTLSFKAACVAPERGPHFFKRETHCQGKSK